MDSWVDSDDDTALTDVFPRQYTSLESHQYNADKRTRRSRRVLFIDETLRGNESLREGEDRSRGPYGSLDAPRGASGEDMSRDLGHEAASGRAAVPEVSVLDAPTCPPSTRHTSLRRSQSRLQFQCPSRSRPASAHSSRSCPDIARMNRIIDTLYENYSSQCRHCGSRDMTKVRDSKDGRVLLLQCEACSEPFGVDDSMSPEVLLELYHQGCIQVPINCCGNTDPDQFKIEGFDGAQFVVRCMQCHQVAVLGETEEAQPPGDMLPSQVPSDGEASEGHSSCKCKITNAAGTTILVWNDSRIVTCSACGEVIEVAEAPQNEVVGIQDMDLLVCTCSPCDKKIKITMGIAGDVEMIACVSCNICVLPRDDVPASKKPRYSSAYTPIAINPTGNTPTDNSTTCDIPTRSHREQGKAGLRSRDVSRFCELRRGDHIKWDRPEGYLHHAIIDRVLPKQNQIIVVHYNGPSPSTIKVKGMIVADQLDPFAKDFGRLFLVEHAAPFLPDQVVERAYSRLGEVEYCLASNNCEHFATWCKTGKHMSSQVETVKECFMKYGSACSKNLVSLAGKSGKVFGSQGVVLAMAGIEIKTCVDEIGKATEDRRNGRLSREAYIHFLVKRVSRSVGGLAGLAIGMRLPIPAGDFIGGTLGGMIGEYAGNQFGKVVIGLYEEFDKRFGK